MAYLSKKKNNSSFILTVCLMIAVIVGLMIPTALAWFTDSSTAGGNTPINFGTVNVGINIPEGEATGSLTNENSATRKLQNLLPGDVLSATIELYNAGSVDIYAKANVGVSITYDGEDITNKLTDYITTSASFAEGTTIEGSEVFTLSTTQTLGNGLVVPISATISNTLPNEVDGYVFNGHTANITVVLTANVAAIQKDNYSYTNVSTLEANSSINFFGSGCTIPSFNTLAFGQASFTY